MIYITPGKQQLNKTQSTADQTVEHINVTCAAWPALKSIDDVTIAKENLLWTTDRPRQFVMGRIAGKSSMKTKLINRRYISLNWQIYLDVDLI